MMNNGMNAAQLAQLQHQLAQQQQQQQQLQPNNPMLANAFGGLAGSHQQQLQQALFQQQGMMNQQRSSTPNLGGGMNNMNAMLMQQQQQQQQQQQHGGNNSNSNAFWNQSAGGAMDASQASSAQLAALAGMNMVGGGGNNNNNVMSNNSNTSSMNPAHQMLLGQRSTSITPQSNQQHHNALLGNLGGSNTSSNNNTNNMAHLFQQQQLQQNNQGMNNIPGMGQTTDAAMLQQQIMQLQRQLQQQQQQSTQNQMGFNMADNNSNNLPIQQPQLQMFNQIMNSSSNNGNMLGDGSQSGSQGGGNDRFSMLMQGGQSANQGINNNQDVMLQQQTQLMRGSNTSQAFQNDAQKVQEMLRRQQQQQQNINSYDLDGSMSSSQQLRLQQQQLSMQQPSSMGDGSSSGGGGGGDDASKSYLDGSFVGGWQSNADLPDRRRIIFSILEVIRQMRPDTNKISEKLPHMAKSLEEHLYRSAQTKEEYLDQSTLKKRLQLIAHGLELHRTTSSNSVQSMGSSASNNMMQTSQSGNNTGNQGLGGIPGMMNNGMGGQNPIGMMQNFGNNNPMQDPVNDRIATQKKKVIRQQQQRLLLLRHASKCKLGSACTTKFCDQMTTLWKHMKKCRDKNCKVSHCLSSRCVLNHYRICKSQGRTATCEVCGPVMEQIKRQDTNEALDSSDPLAAGPNQDLSSSQMGDGRMMDRMSVFGNADAQQNAQLAQQQAMQQLYQQQQQAIKQNQQRSAGNQPQQSVAGSVYGVADELSSSNPQQGTGGNSQQQQQQLQNMQQKFRQQQQVLQQLKKQQAQLLEQQRQLQEQQQQGQQGQQFQQQHALLQQLQQRCQQQQVLIQQELMMTMKGIEQQQQQHQGCSNKVGSQVLGNSSQQSHHSQNSNASHHSQQNQGMQTSQMQQQLGNSNMQSQMLSQNQNSMFGGSNMPEVSQARLMGSSIHSQLSNRMDPLAMGKTNDGDDDNILSTEQERSQHDEKDSLAGGDEQQVINDGPSEQSQPLPEQNPSGTAELTAESSAESGDAAGNDDKEGDGDDDKSPAPAQVSRPKPAGRGGKGKRLRDIADDLGEHPSMDLETAARKRAANELSGRNDLEDAANKAARTEDGPAPDMETSAGSMDGGPSGAANMQRGDVEQHLLMLHKGLHLTSRTITNKCLPIVQQLIDDPYGWVFRDAVDPVVFGLPDYFEVVKNPMHLLLVKKKLENAVYTDMASFERDVKLVFENAILYNGEESEVGQLARTMLGVFEKEYKKVCEDLRGMLLSISPNACKLCGLEKLHFEPPVLYCSGESCGMSRIKRSETYFKDANNQNFWCKTCCNELKKNESIILDDGTEIKKSDLLSAKLDTLPEETFVQCNDCHGKFHKVCALMNSRKFRSGCTFRCPKCVLVRRPSHADTKKIENPESARNLPRCQMSDFMEDGLQKTLNKAYSKAATVEGKSLADIEKATGLCVRVLSHVRKKHRVRDEMHKRYSKFGCPEGFPVHTKCLGLFQTIDGIDVLLFLMYVFEYGQESPPSNRRRVYISYLDSVKYFQPKRFRTVAYQSLIVEYLRWVKRRGFTTAHIWSCPPAPGDEYVFHCHPHTQKVPKEEMLRNWYLSCLQIAKEDGVVVETTDYFTEFFKNHGENAPLGSAPDPTSLPYFEGDYIPGEIESVISNATKEEEINNNRQRHIPKDNNPRRPTSGKRSGTRSNPGQLVNQTQDKIMNRLGIAIFNMKENLIIARLRSKRFCAAVERGDDVSKWPDYEEFRSELERNCSRASCKAQKDSVDGEDSDAEKSEKKDGSPKKNRMNVDEMRSDVPTFGAESKQIVGSKDLPMIGSTAEVDQEFESELFESRQSFLNYCQSNHCQFDEMRRAKHSSMMVLYQLHNPSAPKYVQICAACGCDISAGYRYHCIVCTNYDLCQDCYQPVKSGSWRSRGTKFAHDTSHTFSRINVEASTQADKGREVDQERNKTLQAYLDVLVHAAKCNGPAAGCRSNNCAKMKRLVVHVQTCHVTHSGGCKICARLLSLIIVHARTCMTRGDGCPLPFCDKIRERNERVRRQQLFMDDRRRQAQNAYYQSGE